MNRQDVQKFKAWLIQQQPALIAGITKQNISVTADIWIHLLQVALDHPEDLPLLLDSLNLSQEVIGPLFDITIANLKETDTSLLLSMLVIQGRVLQTINNDLGQSKQTTNTLVKLQELSKVFRQTHQPQQFMPAIVAALSEQFGYVSINLFLLNQTNNNITLQASLWEGKAPSKPAMAAFAKLVTNSNNLIKTVIDTQQTQILNDSVEQPLVLPNGRSLGIQMGTLLKRDDQIIGILHAFQLSLQQISASQRTIFQIIADQLALAIDNVYLRYTPQSKSPGKAPDTGLTLQETQRQLADVSSFYTLFQKIVSILNIEELLDNLVDSIRQIVDCRACVIFLLDQSEQFLEIKAASGLKPKWKEQARLKIGQGAAGQSVAEGKTLYIPDTQNDPSFIFFDRAVRSLIVVPMIHRGKTIGAINLDDSEANAFSSAQERLLTVAATQAAIAIENALLFGQVQSEEQRTKAIIHHMADGLLMVGADGAITHINSMLTTMLGLRYQDIIEQNIYSDTLNPRLAAICSPATRQEKTGVLATEVKLTQPKELVLRIFATPVMDQKGHVLGEVRVVHDVTKERAIEAMKDDLMAMVSHELRTPLFAIRGLIQLLLDKDQPDEATRLEFLKIIDRESNQLAELVTNLLDSEKLSAGTLELEQEPIQINEVIQRTLDKLQGLAQHQKIELNFTPSTDLPLILGDEPRLEQVLTNLVGNAIKFTPAGGFVLLDVQLQNESLTISVTDTGIGIADSDLNQIFDKFYQATNHRTQNQYGSGLGLHITKRLVEKHNGHLWAESELGQGSTFYVRLPALP
ncbi:MAG: ATP-binding protein [Chloroflexota bacterium]